MDFVGLAYRENELKNVPLLDLIVHFQFRSRYLSRHQATPEVELPGQPVDLVIAPKITLNAQKRDIIDHVTNTRVLDKTLWQGRKQHYSIRPTAGQLHTTKERL